MLREAALQWNNLPSGINCNKRSDTIDILNYWVSLDMTDYAGQKMDGFCAIKFVAKINAVSRIYLDLLQLNVDSVTLGNSNLYYKYNDTLLDISLPEMNMGDSAEIIVYYNGSPQQDKSWGGFYFKDNYAYNLGVGFASDPHNYGRVWHPCFDNFMERATYTFSIKTRSNKRAHCNGIMLSENTKEGNTTRVWKLKESIPTYLACIAVGDYTTIKQSHEGIAGEVPVELAANASDTANMIKSFFNLTKAIEAYEYWYGPHRWSKVGYSLVPFRSGAMEHATNITYPIAAANGTLNKESLMAHELGHSWWGNLVTCESAQEMWINEGMASYSVHLFWEHAYGRKRYLREVKKNHYNVMKNAHVREKGYRPVAAVPHAYTYGMHVYDKGASVVHNMRWYLGDSLFRKGLCYITENYQFKNLNTPDFRDALTFATGKDMTAFFDDWLFLGGFPHFEIDQSKVSKRGEGCEMKIHIRQKLLGRKVFCREVPLQLSFIDSWNNKITKRIVVSGALDSALLTLPFYPSSVIINEEHRLNQARYDQQIKLTSEQSGKYINVNGEVGFYHLNLQAAPDSAWLHLEYHPVAPDSTVSGNIQSVSKTHYWSVKGIVPDNLDLKAVLFADAKTDKKLIDQATLDSIVLLYRPSENHAWQIHPDYTKNQNQFAGGFSFSVLKGDYTFGIADVNQELYKSQGLLLLDSLNCEQDKDMLKISIAAFPSSKACVELFGLDGKRLLEKCCKITKKVKVLEVPVTGFKPGIYFLKIRNNKGRMIQSERVLIE